MATAGWGLMWKGKRGSDDANRALPQCHDMATTDPQSTRDKPFLARDLKAKNFCRLAWTDVCRDKYRTSNAQ